VYLSSEYGKKLQTFAKLEVKEFGIDLLPNLIVKYSVASSKNYKLLQYKCLSKLLYRFKNIITLSSISAYLIVFFIYLYLSLRPKEGDQIATEGEPVPTLAPPPKSPQIAAYADSSPRFNPFDKSGIAQDAVVSETAQTAEMTRTDSQVFVLNYTIICRIILNILSTTGYFYAQFLFFFNNIL